MTAQGIIASCATGPLMVGPPALFGTGAPPSSYKGILGQEWIDTSVSPRKCYVFTGAEWITDAQSTGDVDSVTGTANQITASPTTGDVVLSIPAVFIAPGSIASTTTITSGTALVATTTMTAGTGITSTTGNIVATAGNVTAGAAISASTTVTGGTGVIATTGNITATAGEVIAGGDTGGVASTTALTNGNSTTIGAGVGSVKMSSGNNADNAAWVKIYVGVTAYWIPAWTTNSP